MPRLLLIDDDAMVREVLAAALVRAGHTIVQAEDGRRGVNLFRAEPADLVITDLVMPDSEGLEVIVALHREWPALPIIAMSGGTAHSSLYLSLATKLGARRALAKPFASTELLQVIDELLLRPPDAAGAPQ
jgi:DNA-binding response OmpR family regulator